MKNSKLLFLEEEATKSLFYPFTFTTKLEDLRFGIFTIKERWQLLLKDFLLNNDENLVLNPLVIPTKEIVNSLGNLQIQDVLYDINNVLIAYIKEPKNHKTHTTAVEIIENKTSLLLKNNTQFFTDISLLTIDKKNISDEHTKVYGQHPIHIGENVKLQSIILNAEDGPIYIDDNVKILGNSVIHGPCYIGKKSVIMPHTFLRNGVSCGENCVLAGEIKNTIIGNCTNKGHYGYLGDSIIGNYCNFGAGTTTSNLKNNFSFIRIYNDKSKQLEKSALTKCGIFMGDYTLTAVNTVFFAGTTIYPINNIFDNVAQQKFHPGCTWGKTMFKIEKLDSFIQNILTSKHEKLSPEKSAQIHKLYTLLIKKNA